MQGCPAIFSYFFSDESAEARPFMELQQYFNWIYSDLDVLLAGDAMMGKRSLFILQ
jgi:hypothetical protein